MRDREQAAVLVLVVTAIAVGVGAVYLRWKLGEPQAVWLMQLLGVK